MEQRYFFRLSYGGSSFCGWQRQPNSPSVQEEIESALAKLYSHLTIAVVGCGRTDTGVHASEYFLHVDLPERFSPADLKFKLNGILPDSIAVQSVFLVSPEAHARFDATERTYYYFIHHQKDPFKVTTSYYHKGELDIKAMNDACKCLIGRKDFTSFSKLHTDVKTNICELTLAKFSYLDANTLRFEITANRFLRNMVRAIVGTLLEVGQGKLSWEDVQAILEKKDRGEAGTSAPAQGLFLAKINYPFETY